MNDFISFYFPPGITSPPSGGKTNLQPSSLASSQSRFDGHPGGTTPASSCLTPMTILTDRISKSRGGRSAAAANCGFPKYEGLHWLTWTFVKHPWSRQSQRICAFLLGKVTTGSACLKARESNNNTRNWPETQQSNMDEFSKNMHARATSGDGRRTKEM